MRIPIKHGLALALACAALHAPALPAQIEPAVESERAFCWVGRPAESCRTFLVAEASAHLLVAGTRYTRRDYNGPLEGKWHLVGHFGWEVGVMRNLDPRHAVGATVLVGGDANGVRLALKGRYREWRSRRAAMDVGAGFLVARRAEPFADRNRPGNQHVVVAGLTGDVALGLTDWASVSLRADLLFDADGKPVAGVYPGFKLGTRPGLAATVLPFVLGVIAILVVGPGG